MSWTKNDKPATCLNAPWEYLIPKEQLQQVSRQIRQESIEAYGQALDECPKRKVCLTKACLGRPLPWKSKTAKPYLEALEKAHDVRNGELFIQTDCSKCTFFKTCDNPCPQINDFLERDKSIGPNIAYKEKTDSIVPQKIDFGPGELFVNGSDVPWDCLTDLRTEIVKQYLYEGKDFKFIADKLNLNNQARVKYEFYSALTKLSEFAIIRKFLDAKGHELNGKEWRVLHGIYIALEKVPDIAKEMSLTDAAIYQIRLRTINKHKLKWKKFVQKKNYGTVVYQVPEILK